ncbi:insc [Drosophila busckii]|uniref:Insc n=1 Tax=Drosophila busckii TaxID=30019 RepID=A0A0M3QV01_DROBS|nr:protein inscuteable homolog [Drosophila busckii]ALC41523.1 insc [Drosophila busckii]
MSFQRSYSKVWWGSESQQLGGSFTSGGYYSHYNYQQQQQQPASLDSALQRHQQQQEKQQSHQAGNLSSIQEDDEQNCSKLSWHKHDSPGSLRSQDSGFSDNEEQHNSQTQAAAAAAAGAGLNSSSTEEATPSASPTSLRSIATPPTVIRRVGNSAFYSPLVNVTRRISFSGLTTQQAVADDEAVEDDEASRSRLFEQLDSMQLDDKDMTVKATAATPPRAARRRKRKSKQQLNELELIAPPPAYNNETVYLGEAPPPYNNETVTFGIDEELEPLSPLRSRFTASTSTPKAARSVKKQPQPVPSWLTDQRWSCEPEVMCMLQHKSIAQEAYKNFTITNSAVAKLMRQLQQQALQLQSQFERCERVLNGQQACTLPEALASATQLLTQLDEFTRTLERRSIFFNEDRLERRRYDQQLQQIRTVGKDARYSLERQHYMNLESLLDDVQLLKRHTLIALRLIFQRLARILVLSIEQSRCDLLLRANINMLATLMNIDYDGFASLSDAFVQNEAVRALLLIVLDHKLSSVRALALRALATLCCAPPAIVQLGSCGGIEIVRDILQPQQQLERGAIERREAVSLLAQITASWHGPEHRVAGLRAAAESLVAGLAALLQPDCCSQTLLLCAAALNNLSRMELTSHYSIMSNEAIFKLISTLEHQSSGISVFLYEQIVGMLHNMSLNKKCHSHLANGIIINFITSVYQTEFYKTYGSRAECDAQRRSIKSVLHTLTRLVQDSHTLGAELVEQWRLPELLRQSLASSSTINATAAQLDNSAGYSGDISHLARQLLQSHQQEQLLLLATATSQDMPSGAFSSAHQTPEAQATTTKKSKSPTLKFNLTRQESFV